MAAYSFRNAANLPPLQDGMHSALELPTLSLQRLRERIAQGLWIAAPSYARIGWYESCPTGAGTIDAAIRIGRSYICGHSPPTFD